MKKPKNVLIVYKKSAYEIYVLKNNAGLFRPGKGPEDASYIRRYRRSHDEQAQTLDAVKRTLNEFEVRFGAVHRNKPVNHARYDFIICVGGDGTFLGAAHHVKNQPVLGVNSDPSHSIGYFCKTDRHAFRRVFRDILQGKSREIVVNRLALSLNGRLTPFPVLNEVLVCHSNPAAMSRYWLKAGRVREEQKSSGVWISTAAGSTGAIRSAGGRALKFGSRDLQFRVREPYVVGKKKLRLKGGLLAATQDFRVGSLMREGVIYVDGPHVSIPFRYGDTLRVTKSRFPLRLIDTQGSRT